MLVVPSQIFNFISFFSRKFLWVVFKNLNSVYHPKKNKSFIWVFDDQYTQPVIASSKVTIEALEQGVKYVQS